MYDVGAPEPISLESPPFRFRSKAVGWSAYTDPTHNDDDLQQQRQQQQSLQTPFPQPLLHPTSLGKESPLQQQQQQQQQQQHAQKQEQCEEGQLHRQQEQQQQQLCVQDSPAPSVLATARIGGRAGDPQLQQQQQHLSLISPQQKQDQGGGGTATPSSQRCGGGWRCVNVCVRVCVRVYGVVVYMWCGV